MKAIRHYIGGAFRSSEDGRTLDDYEPATGGVWARVSAGSAVEIEAAVQAAREAFPGWSATPAERRADWLRRLADAVEAEADSLAALEARDNGKPVSVARDVDIPRAARNLRFFGGAVEHTHTEAHRTDDAALNYTVRRPIGVAGCISPWNLPLYLFTWKIAPALAVGCTVVGKPSEVTPATAHRLSELADAIGFPAGVLNVVH
ncbi:MAG: aldehyde dehydrogenase family protein, partial [Planctomycetota bacterium]|nr:aldehyde dehydrogenase family protein [Planctomycetota bacterium]